MSRGVSSSALLLHEKRRHEDGLVSDEESIQIPELYIRVRVAKRCLIISFIMLLTSVSIFVAARMQMLSEKACAKRLSSWSSMWDAVEFWEGDPTNYWNHSTIYRGPPIPEREQAWRDLWDHPGIPVTRAGVAALNKTAHGKHIEAVDSNPDAPTYAAIVEVFHQLHCLNLIRQYTWFLTGHYNANDESMRYPTDFINPVAGRMHVDHCIEALRIDLMCYGDITPLLLEYDDTRAVGAVADFSVHHKCRNFEKIIDWVKQNGVDIPPLPGSATDEEHKGN